MDRAHRRVAAGLAVALLACLIRALKRRARRHGLVARVERSGVFARLTGSVGAVLDIVSGSNGYNPRVPGINAIPGYDMASGLGVPRFDQLAAAPPPPAP